MAKHSLYTILTASLLLVLGTVSCNHEDPGTGQRLTMVNAYFDTGGSKVALSQTGTLDLISRWEPTDRLDLFVNGEKVGSMIPAGNISDDGKKCTFGVDFSEETYPGEVFFFGATSNANTTIIDGEYFCNASIVRSSLARYSAPVATQLQVTDRKNVSVRFKHYLAYEVVRIRNTSGKAISYSLNGYYNAAGLWYYEKGATSLNDGSLVVDTKATEDPVTKSDYITIDPESSGVIISAYLPNGHEIEDAMMVADIDGTTVNSTNRLSSHVIMEAGHAYHVYATWDGTTLKFTTESGESGSEVDGGGSGYGSDSGGDVIGGGIGYVYDDSGNVIGIGTGYGSDGSGQISGGGTGYPKGN